MNTELITYRLVQIDLIEHQENIEWADVIVMPSDSVSFVIMVSCKMNPKDLAKVYESHMEKIRPYL